jgi:NADH dehydrogenase
MWQAHYEPGVAAVMSDSPPLRYFDKGNMAVIDRNVAILESGKLRLSGFPAWAAWAAIHLVYLPQHRGETLRRWGWAYLRGARGSRLILDAQRPPDGAR